MLNELHRWVDPRVSSVRVAEVRAYLLGKGWTPRPAPRPHQLAFEAPGDTPDGPVVIYTPAEEQFADYSQRILEVITELAEVEDRYAVDVLNDILRSCDRGRPNGPAEGRAREVTPAAGA